ncbi:hypothetical protein MRB53_033127 [Persea americana]|uniref:Uncharacterized protein n=1 Tax=Persea americana TaxID=3435 RepID=A0ACC2KTS5_PERAE|nr:hypothetical protein MRB53_033127 [Persea americana]
MGRAATSPKRGLPKKSGADLQRRFPCEVPNDWEIQKRGNTSPRSDHHFEEGFSLQRSPSRLPLSSKIQQSSFVQKPCMASLPRTMSSAKFPDIGSPLSLPISPLPRPALPSLPSFVEGSTSFYGSGRRWERKMCNHEDGAGRVEISKGQNEKLQLVERRRDGETEEMT